MTLKYVDPLLILTSVINGCVLISAFAALVGILIGIKNFALGLKICAKITEIKKNNSIIKKRGKSW